MSNQPTMDDSAAVAVVLDDKVRELVRMHLREALEDPTFLRDTGTFPLAQRMLPDLAVRLAGDNAFISYVSRAIGQKLSTL